MKSKTKKILGIVIFLALLVGLIYAYNQGMLPFAVSGTSYLSISDIDVIDSGQRMVILATGGSAEQLLIRFTNSDLNQKLASEGYSVDKGISTDILINKWQHTYPIQLTSNTYKTIGSQNIDPYIGSEFSCDLSDCTNSKIPQIGNYVFAYAYSMSVIPLKYNCRCIYYNPSDRIGQFLGDIQQLNYNIDFKIGSETKSMNNQNLVVSLVNGNFRAEYVGNLGTQFQRTKPGYDVLYKNGMYTNLVPSAGYNYPGRYGSIGSPQSYLTQCVGGIDLSKCTWLADGCTDEVNKVNGCLNNYNSDFSVGSSNKNNEYKSNNNVESMSFSGNNLIVNSDIPTFQPVFKIFIDASWIGLKELKGEPDITSCVPNVEITGGTSKQVSLKVKNIGADAGQFDYSVTCQSNQVSFSGAGSLVNAGQEQIINVLFSGTNTNPNQDLTGTCTHTIVDRKSQKKDTCTSTYTVKYNDLICTPGELRCGVSNNKIIERCNELGNAWEIYQNCGDKYCSFISGVVSCGDVPPPSETCESCNEFALSKLVGSFWKEKECTPKFLQTFTTCIFSFLRLLLVPIVLIFSVLFGLDFVGSFKALKGNKLAIWIITLIIALILSYIVYVSFWIGLIVFIVYLIIRMFLGFGGYKGVKRRLVG